MTHSTYGRLGARGGLGSRLDGGFDGGFDGRLEFGRFSARR